jgi:hypothetical protein
VLGANYSATSGTVKYSASTEDVFNLSGSNTITLGLLNLGSYGKGFSSLSFTVKEGATTLLTDSFTSLAAAQTFFTDDPVSLGKLSGPVDLTLSYQLTANQAEGAGISFVLADAPAASGAKPSATAMARQTIIAGLRSDAFGSLGRFSLVMRNASLPGAFLNRGVMPVSMVKH